MMKTIVNFFKNLPEWAFLLIYLGALFMYKAIIGLQGLDMCDEGWMLSGYQQIFNDPASCEYQFLYYNTLLVGGAWNALFGAWGIYGFRICEAICATLTAYIVYRLLRKDINRWCILIGVFLFNIDYVLVIHYNSLTALVLSLAVLGLYQGLTKVNKWYMLLAGLLVGLNIFTRLPNIALCSLVLVFIPFYLYTRNGRQTLSLVSMALLGVLLGVAIEIGLMCALGHWSLFIDNISSGLSAASAGDSSHSVSRFLGVYINNYKVIGTLAAFIISIPLILYAVRKLSPYKKIYNAAIIIGSVLYFSLVWQIVRYNFTMYAMCYPIFFAYLLKFPNDSRRVLLISIAIIILLFLPFGSDGGIATMECGSMLWIAVPLAIGVFYELAKSLSISSQKLAYVMASVFVIAFASKALYNTSLMCYFDSGSRLKKTARAETALATIYTTDFKAAQLDTLMLHLEPLIQRDDYLLCFQSVPMVNYLTETRPYLGNSWPWTYDSDNMERQFIKAKSTIPTLPVIVRNKSEVATWYRHSEDWDNVNSGSWCVTSRKIELIQNFIRDNGYTIHWENDLFQILVPPSNN